jgi:hypothetical protein
MACWSCVQVVQPQVSGKTNNSKGVEEASKKDSQQEQEVDVKAAEFVVVSAGMQQCVMGG